MNKRIRKEINREIYELGELERDAELLADFSPHNGLLAKFWRWLASIIRRKRLDRIEERNELEHSGGRRLSRDEIMLALLDLDFERGNISLDEVRQVLVDAGLGDATVNEVKGALGELIRRMSNE